MKVRQKQNGQIFVNENGLFNVYVFFQGQEYDISEMIYNYKPSIFEILEPRQEQFEPRGETKSVEQVVDFEPRTKNFEPIEEKVEQNELKEEQVDVEQGGETEKIITETKEVSETETLTEPGEVTEVTESKNVFEGGKSSELIEQIEKEQPTEKRKSRKK